jgi:hypothetical protein
MMWRPLCEFQKRGFLEVKIDNQQAPRTAGQERITHATEDAVPGEIPSKAQDNIEASNDFAFDLAWKLIKRNEQSVPPLEGQP